MKIVFFGNAPDSIAAIRYRVQTFARMLEEEGHRCIICLPASAQHKARNYDNQSRGRKLLYLIGVLLRRLAQLRHVINADVIYLRGPLFGYGPPVLEHILHFLNPHMIFDIDDAVWERPAYVDSPFLRFTDFNWAFKMARLCSHAVVGNQYLADHLKDYPVETAIIPTCIDMERHSAKTYDAKTAPVLLGWTGLKDNLGYFELIEEVLQDLAKRHDIQLLVATGADYALEGITVENHRWRLEEEIDYLQRPQIGLMPLTDSPRARGKCAFKALQFMAVGTPCVVSPVGMNADIIEDGVDGFLADSPEAWGEKLERLITDPALRERMGLAAREKVRQHYSHAVYYSVLKKVLEETAQGKPQAR